MPAVALAHPLGNFTINHYAGLRVGPERIDLDVVIDQAELPTFTERQRIDSDGDGSVSDDELEAERLAACGRLAGSLSLTVDGKVATLTAFAAGISLPPGAAGLSTLRTVCEYTAPIAAGDTGATVAFEDRSFPRRIGWREIRVQGDGTTRVRWLDRLDRGQACAGGPVGGPRQRAADRLPVLAGRPAADDDRGELPGTGRWPDPRAVRGPRRQPAPRRRRSRPPPRRPSPTPAGIGSVVAPVGAAPGPTAIPGSASIPTGAVPGGVQDQIAGLLATKDLSPLALIGSLLLAAFLGALHAVSPGHGKTVMAAYLVGSRGSARHAAALGLTVTVSHTLGVLALAAVALFAAQLIPPERLYPILGVASGATVIGIGCWLLVGRLRLMRTSRALRPRTPPSTSMRRHDHEHEHPHDRTSTSTPRRRRPASTATAACATRTCRSGGDLTWRSLFALGLAGGLVPSASALLLLLGSLAANRAGYGLVLVVAFGAGMAIVLAGIGLALVYATRWIERVPRGSSFQRAWDLLPLGTALVVVVAGIYLTSQSLLVTF